MAATEPGQGGVTTRLYDSGRLKEKIMSESGEDARDATDPDVYLDVPLVKVEEIDLDVHDLRAKVSLQAEVLDLLRLNVGADVFLGSVSLTIKGVEAQAMLQVRLDNVARIIDRVLQTIDTNPQILANITRGVGSAVEDVGSGAGYAVRDVGAGAGGAVRDVGAGAGVAVRDVGAGAGGAVRDVGVGAGGAVRDVGAGAGSAVRDVGAGTGAVVRDVGAGAGDAVEDAVRVVRDVGPGVAPEQSSLDGEPEERGPEDEQPEEARDADEPPRKRRPRIARSTHRHHRPRRQEPPEE